MQSFSWLIEYAFPQERHQRHAYFYWPLPGFNAEKQHTEIKLKTRRNGGLCMFVNQHKLALNREHHH
jgi:hypothetical protein